MYAMYAMIAAANSVFPFFLATISSTSRNCLLSKCSGSITPKMADATAFCHSSSFRRSARPSE